MITINHKTYIFMIEVIKKFYLYIVEDAFGTFFLLLY
jgi:hypothetical protein